VVIVERVIMFVRCGALHVGDQVLSINDVPLDSASVSEAMRQLQCDAGDQLVLEILPKIRNRAMRMMSAASSLSSNSSITCQFLVALLLTLKLFKRIYVCMYVCTPTPAE